MNLRGIGGYFRLKRDVGMAAMRSIYHAVLTRYNKLIFIDWIVYLRPFVSFLILDLRACR